MASGTAKMRSCFLSHRLTCVTGTSLLSDDAGEVSDTETGTWRLLPPDLNVDGLLLVSPAYDRCPAQQGMGFSVWVPGWLPVRFLWSDEAHSLWRGKNGELGGALSEYCPHPAASAVLLSLSWLEMTPTGLSQAVVPACSLLTSQPTGLPGSHLWPCHTATTLTSRHISSLTSGPPREA